MVGMQLLVFILVIFRATLSLQGCNYFIIVSNNNIVAIKCYGLIIDSNTRLFPIYSTNESLDLMTAIVVENSTVNVIPNQFFKQFPLTEKIFLNEQQVKVIGETPFIGLHKLERLYLPNNLLTNLTQDAFTDLTALRFLDLHNNQISYMDDNVFQGLVQRDLKETHELWIDLSNNKLTYINDEYFKDLKQLDILELQCNIIANISVGAFRDLDNIKKLNLSSNQLEHLEIGLFSALRRLVFLDLSKNKLIAFDVNELSTSVRHIFINDNMLTYLDVVYLGGSQSQYPIYLSMNNNSWTCSWLSKAIQLLDNKINITRANSFNVTNINGIDCIENKTINLPITNANLATDISTSDTPQTSTHQNENDKFYKLLQLISDAIN